jgi:uncharacterized coiled-coil DUF342 family protein
MGSRSISLTRGNTRSMAQKVRHQTDKEAEYYRGMVVSQGNEIEILRNNVKELQGQLQGAYRRIGELREALDIEVKENRNEPEIIVDRSIFPAV